MSYGREFFLCSWKVRGIVICSGCAVDENSPLPGVLVGGYTSWRRDLNSQAACFGQFGDHAFLLLVKCFTLCSTCDILV